MASNQVQESSCQTETIRHTANFHPTVWGDYFLKYASASEEVDIRSTEEQSQKLKEEVNKILAATNDPLQTLELIDTINRLGFSYHFEDIIIEMLKQIKNINVDESLNDDLHGVALWFRLLRQEGYNVSSDIFKKFTNKEGKFKDELTRDVQGLLSLYEASHLRVHGEPILEEALSFTVAGLRFSIASSNLSTFLVEQVKHALEQPIWYGLPRVEARHFISIYHEDPSRNKILLNFAKLDFNIVQKMHQKELCEVTRWRKHLEIESTLSYARDRLVEAYFWNVGVYFEPKYALARSILIKIFCFVSIIDDTYDAHATYKELQVFTDAIHRWDISCLDHLPKYMQHLYKALLDTYDQLEELIENEGGGSYRIKYAKHVLKDHVQSYFEEAKWLSENYVPTLEEYMQLALVSCGYCSLSTASLLGMGDIATEQVFQWASNFPKIIRAASIVNRLRDDIVGHKFEQKRGHVSSSIECYVKQYGVTEEEAYVKFYAQIIEAWKDINQEWLEPRDVPMTVLTRVVNFARVMDVIYKKEDSYTHAQGLMKELIKSTFVEPFLM